jgi:hypothetical protein
MSLACRKKLPEQRESRRCRVCALAYRGATGVDQEFIHRFPLINPSKGIIMNSIIYIVGLVVVVLFVASFFGLR